MSIAKPWSLNSVKFAPIRLLFILDRFTVTVTNNLTPLRRRHCDNIGENKVTPRQHGLFTNFSSYFRCLDALSKFLRWNTKRNVHYLKFIFSPPPRAKAEQITRLRKLLQAIVSVLLIFVSLFLFSFFFCSFNDRIHRNKTKCKFLKTYSRRGKRNEKERRIQTPVRRRDFSTNRYLTI